MRLSAKEIRRDYDCLSAEAGGRAPICFDNACMTLKPNQVVDAMTEFYKRHPACHNRSAHRFGKEVTEKYHQSKERIREYLNASSSDELVFTRNTTESINLLAHTLPLGRGDTVLSSDLEHNSNLLPWQVLSRSGRGVAHRTFSIGPSQTGEDLTEYESLLREGDVKLVSVFHTSNVTGITLPIKKMVRLAHQHGALFLLDAAQGIAHHRIDVRELDVDFLALSFHKVFGPTGMGLLYGKKRLLNELPPFLIGGGTVVDSDYATHTLSAIPERFEAGLQDYAGIIGAGVAIKYLSSIGATSIREHEHGLNKYITEELLRFERVRLVGPEEPQSRGSIVNFLVEGLDSGELCVLLDKAASVMVRGGVHCCHAWYRKYKLRPSVRISLSVYNTAEEAEALVKALRGFLNYF